VCAVAIVPDTSPCPRRHGHGNGSGPANGRPYGRCGGPVMTPGHNFVVRPGMTLVARPGHNFPIYFHVRNSRHDSWRILVVRFDKRQSNERPAAKCCGGDRAVADSRMDFGVRLEMLPASSYHGPHWIGHRGGARCKRAPQDAHAKEVSKCDTESIATGKVQILGGIRHEQSEPMDTT